MKSWRTAIRIAVLAAAGAAAAPPPAPAPGLIAHWTMDALDHEVVPDVAGNGFVAQFASRKPGVEGPEFVPGLVDAAVKFEEPRQEYLTVADSEDLNFPAVGTVMAWVRPSRATARHTGEVLCKGFDYGERRQAPWHGWRLRLGWSRFSFRYTPEDGPAVQVNTPGGSAPPEFWTHVALTFDGSTFRIFVNATERAAFSGKGNPTASTCPLVIGNYVGSKSAYAYDGLIDEVKIFDKPLNKDEIWREANPCRAPREP